MHFLSYVVDAWNTIVANKLRSGLSSLWIIIWVSSVVILLAIGTGTKTKLIENMWSMISNSVTVTSSSSSNGAVLKKLPMDAETVSFIENTFVELSGKVTYIKTSNQTAVRGVESANATVNGVPANYFTLWKNKLTYGSFFTAEDVDNGAAVVVLSYGSLSALFDDANPVGQTIKIKWKRFTVIGVLEKTSMESMRRSSSVTAYIPSTTLMEQISLSKTYDSIVVYLPDNSDNPTWTQLLQYALLRRVWGTDIAQAGFSVISYASFVETLQSTITMLTYFLWAIGGISLFVWGIGVMNIMIVSVTERTREIGIRKAIGALKKDIIMQFLTESIVITLTGWAIAIILSYAIVYGINAVVAIISSKAASTSWGWGGLSIYLEITGSVVALAFGLTTFTGVVFGILPAQKAVQLKPIDALRFE